MPIQNEKQRVELSAEDPISITVDAGDLSSASAEPLRNIINRFGRPVSARAFADFQQPQLAELAVQLYQMGFTLVHCPTWPNGDGTPKSVVSDILAQDLRDQLEELEGVETFLVAATSREYIAVANALRRHDKRVVIIAEELKVARELRMCADEFALLPPFKADRPITPIRSSRATTATRLPSPRIDRPVEAPRTAPEPVKAVEPLKQAPEPQKIEKPAEPVRAADRNDSVDLVRLPVDNDVLAEVRRIVAAEGICTPRRLARALCPVDKTPTGELRSRIANRIQSLIDSGKLLRERLVVGGTSVETILVREERDPKVTATPPGENVPSQQQGAPAMSVETPPVLEKSVVEAVGNHDFGLPKVPDTVIVGEKNGTRAGRDLDALVESVLRSPEIAAGLTHRDPAPEPVSASESPTEPSEAVAEPVAEAPKRSRSRRRAPAKKTAPESEAAD